MESKAEWTELAVAWKLHLHIPNIDVTGVVSNPQLTPRAYAHIDIVLLHAYI